MSASFTPGPGGISGSQSLNAAAASGTALEGGPATLPNSDATEGITIASLPGGALDIHDEGTNTRLFVVAFGAGRIGFHGFDWFEPPTPADWENVLGRAVTEVTAQQVPAPGALALLGIGLVALGFLRRRED